jgi:leucyl/phenylalanyl-tRNA--protein transferase
MPIYALNERLVFPPPELADPPGILAVGGDLSVERLLLAYRHGIFPWYSNGEPIIWWCPDPRAVLYPESLIVSDSMRRVMKSGRFEITFDTDFRSVIGHCQSVKRPGQDGTWITREMQEAYGRLHEAGYAHSVETRQDGKLVGGLYGVSLGRIFFGESMFARVSNASKAALVTLVERLKTRGFSIIDCQVPTDHLMSLGAVEIARKDFLKQLREALRGRTWKGPWTREKP